jgi:6-phosphogluconolactonase (cycloisomerase 2 family)
MPRWISLTPFIVSLALLNGPVMMSQTRPVAGATILYAAVGAELTWYDIDVNSGSLGRRGSVILPANVQEAWKHPSKAFLYVAWSNGGASYSGGSGVGPAGNRHGVSAYRIDRTTGALTLYGEPALLPSRPIYVTTDMDGSHVITAHNAPSGLTVHRLLPDGDLGGEVRQAAELAFGIYGHQVRIDPSNRAVILVTRGNGPTATKPEDPGAIRIFNYKDGVLSPRSVVAPNGGFGFQVRHLDFHPSGKWAYVDLERQNRLEVYRRSAEGALSETPIFTKDTLADRSRAESQTASSIHVHPNGKFIYVANRSSATVEFQGKRVSDGGENTIAVFAINQATGEPTLIQSADTRGFTPRTFALDASGQILVVANQSPGLVRDRLSTATVPARLTVFRIRSDGKLEFRSQQDVETGGGLLFWTGIVPMP